MGRFSSIRLACWLAVVLLSARAAIADGVILNGVSPITIGRGGTNLGHTDNGSILHDNPAAMSFMEYPSLMEVGATVLITDFGYRDPDNNATSEHTPYPLPDFSIIKRAPGTPWAFGLGAFAPAGFGSKYELNGPAPFAGPRRYESFGMLAKLLPGVSYQVNDRLSVGATLGVGITVASLEGPYTLQGPTLGGVPTLMNLDANGAALVWSTGLMYKLSDATTLGVTYQSESRFEAEGDTNVITPLGEADYQARLNITWPRSVGVGMRHELCPHRILSADVIWFNWNSAFDDFGIHLDRPENPFFPPVVEERFPLDWRDTVSVRLGYEQKLSCDRTIRLGYVYHRVPIPSATITPFIPAPLEHAFSTGYGWRWNGWNVDASYMFTFGPEVAVQTSDFLGGDFDQSFHTARTHAIGLSFLRRW